MNNAWRQAGAQWVLASGNRGKLAELNTALSDMALQLRPLSDWTDISPEETGDTFEANAIIKARHAAQLTGLPSLADDSGLAVDALNGAPGVYSARYAGADATDAANNAKLLAALADIKGPQRSARFVCVIALLRGPDDDNPLLARGEWQGVIAHQASGSAGFGYDPLFVDPTLNKSAAELSAQDKLARSHRGQAIAQLKQLLAQQA